MRTPRRSPRIRLYVVPTQDLRQGLASPKVFQRVAGRLPFKEAHIVPTQAVQDTDLPGEAR